MQKFLLAAVLSVASVGGLLAASEVAQPSNQAQDEQAPAFYQKNQAVWIWSQGQWFKGHVLKADNNTGNYYVTYDDFDARYNEWVNADLLKPR